MSIRFDKALSGANRVSLVASVPPPGSGITFTCWAFFVSSTANFADLLRIHNGTGSNTTLTFGALGTGTGMTLYSASGSVPASGMAAGTWYRLAYTLTGTTAKAYMITATGVTGVFSGTVTPGSTPTGLTFGARGTTAADAATEFVDMRLSQARIWSSVLTQTQIEAEWASTTPVVTAALYASWPLTTASDLTDHSGGGHTLVPNATTPTTEAEPPNGAVTGSGTATLTLTASGTGAKTASRTGTATLALSSSGTGKKTATAARPATLALTATGTGSKRAIVVSSATVALSATGIGGKAALRASSAALALMASGVGLRHAVQQSSAVLTLLATGTGSGVAPVVGSGAATLHLTASGTGRATRSRAGTAVLTLTATGRAGTQRDLTLTVTPLPSRWTLTPAESAWRFTPLPSRWTFQEAP